MDDKILNQMIDIVRKNPFGCLATTDGISPRARYITIRGIEDDLTLVCATSAVDNKVKHIRMNPNVHIITGFPPAEEGRPNISIEATVSIYTDPATKEKYWEESFYEHFSGSDHEHYVILKLHPRRAWLSTGEEYTKFRTKGSKLS